MGALAILPNNDGATPAAAFTPQLTVARSAASAATAPITLSNAPSMVLPAPPAGPAVRFAAGAPSVAGLVGVTTPTDLDQAKLRRVAKLDELFEVPGTPIKRLPTGYHHPLLTGPEPADATQDSTSTDSTNRKYPEPTPEQWAQLRWCESSGNYQVTNFSGKYRGAYQFDQATWESVGGSGDPAAAAPPEQDKRAKILYDTRGSSPWPYCGRYLD